MSLKWNSVLAVLVCVVNCNGEETVDYYVNLITKETARAFTYQQPQDSSAYRPSSDGFASCGIYDYIIVGAGSAGAVIANRLSEDSDKNILLLEAGGNETDFSDIPRMNIYLQGLEFNWNYNTTPQTTSCLGMFNRQCACPRGKGLGGTSVINALMYVRGNRRDYDNWQQQGNPGWAYEDVLPYFKKSENSLIDGDPGYHGKGGYLNVEYHKPYSPQFDAFIEANIELGRKVVDYNGKYQLGVARTQLNNINSRRDSTGKAFLRPATGRSNLKILTHSLVTKILINPFSKKAYGVLFSRLQQNGEGSVTFIAIARQEVIVSAGTINSPQLLMLSGIGPTAHLKKLGIPVIQPLSVGDNYQDQTSYYALHFETNYSEPIRSLEENVEEYLKGVGPLTIAGNAQGLGFFQTKFEKTPGYPDIELIMVPSNNTGNFIQKAYRYSDEAYNAIWTKIDPRRTFTLFLMLLHPKSKGTIRLKSKCPYEYPLINPMFLSDSEEKDIETLYQGVQLALEIINTSAFKKLNATLMYAPLPACKHHKYLSRDYWFCQLRQLTFHIFHPVGTCKMGPNPCQGAVVDHKLKVHGIQNLRVADASIIPEPTSGHTNAVAVMIGEKVADLIRRGK